MLLVCLAAGAFLGGCASSQAPTTRPATAYERSEKALKDPFGYSPDVQRPEDITGGGIGDFDRKGFDRDANSFINP